jgi:hypothetical protein
MSFLCLCVSLCSLLGNGVSSSTREAIDLSAYQFSQSSNVNFLTPSLRRSLHFIKFKAKVILRQTVIWPVCPDIKHQTWAQNLIYITVGP